VTKEKRSQMSNEKRPADRGNPRAASDTDLIQYLFSTAAIRERCGQVMALAEKNQLEHFILNSAAIEQVVELVREEILRNYPQLDVPVHSRWRHFSVGGVPREGRLDQALSGRSLRERCRAKLEVAIVSVLLDAGAGADWSFMEVPGGPKFQRSEGLAVASIHAFASGIFGDTPYTVTARKLRSLSREDLAGAFQVSTSNPLLGLEGRVDLLNTLGRVIEEQPENFPGDTGRLGSILESVEAQVTGSEIRASALLKHILTAFGPIWPGRLTLGGYNLGDVWHHSKVSGEGETNTLVPFHKLSQWLTYSLLEPLQEGGIRVASVNDLTGLPEYRNGGLFIDSGVLALRDSVQATREHSPSSELIVEWRALTVALLDIVADKLRAALGMNPEELPLGRVLQGGTWSLGRKIAAERRPRGVPPLTIVSDGTVF
jgi:hypothetical protein